MEKIFIENSLKRFSKKKKKIFSLHLRIFFCRKKGRTFLRFLRTKRIQRKKCICFLRAFTHKALRFAFFFFEKNSKEKMCSAPHFFRWKKCQKKMGALCTSLCFFFLRKKIQRKKIQ